MKGALTRPHALALPDFSKPFFIECDASSKWVGAILMQQGMPISILSQTLKRKTLLLSIHEKKFYAIVMAIQKWKAYLLGRCFIITIYYQILKYLLD